MQPKRYTSVNNVIVYAKGRGMTERRENRRTKSERSTEVCELALPLHLRGKIFIHIPNYFIE